MRLTHAFALGFVVLTLAACSSEDEPAGGNPGGRAPGGNGSADGGGGGGPPVNPKTDPSGAPAAGNPNGGCAVPAEAQLEDVGSPRTVVGTGTPESCTGEAFVDAVAKGGVITFDCGPEPATITLTTTAKIFNDKGPIVIDGGGKITLSGGGAVRILYQNACDKEQVWTSSDCNNQENPKLSLQNLTFVDGNAKGLETGDNRGGGGALYARGGRVKIINCRFFNNVCDDRGSDVGGGAIRVLDHPADTSENRPVYIVQSTFGASEDGMGNVCANGGALSSIGTSYTVLNSVFYGNRAIGEGANDGEGGNGGAIYNDGNTFTLNVCGTIIEDNRANEGGSAIFFVSNNETGSLDITDSTLRRNPRGKFETPGYPGIFVKAKKGSPTVTNSTIE